MKREEFQELCRLSEEALGHRYAWKKLRKQGLVHGKYRVGRRGAVANRTPLSVEGVRHYLKTTLDMREKMKQDMEAQDESGR